MDWHHVDTLRVHTDLWHVSTDDVCKLPVIFGKRHAHCPFCALCGVFSSFTICQKGFPLQRANSARSILYDGIAWGFSPCLHHRLISNLPHPQKLAKGQDLWAPHPLALSQPDIATQGLTHAFREKNTKTIKSDSADSEIVTPALSHVPKSTKFCNATEQHQNHSCCQAFSQMDKFFICSHYSFRCFSFPSMIYYIWHPTHECQGWRAGAFYFKGGAK